ncbi:PSMB1 [Lepeophtheirus salmonis]|uniref:PSMB1 n=1 Tax=Lepeophtheirus salmonis TaxID=72036 RepID=A0A7R8H3E6_LEPSM|nr:PSMB1 [Lepeophtheirus salmonis]CAF2830237.1 PSMB1 [Lepeophtheirus salmonis]
MLMMMLALFSPARLEVAIILVFYNLRSLSFITGLRPLNCIKMKLLGIEGVGRKAELSDYSMNPHQVSFQPYQDNGGTTIGIAGKDFVVIASDTRLCNSYDILSRDVPKVFDLGGNSVLGASGCWCDVLTFIRVAESRIKNYNYTHGKEMSTSALAQMLSITLYRKRFFPYYIHNVLAGLDDEGRGAIFTYDPVGHCEKVKISCGGCIHGNDSTHS